MKNVWCQEKEEEAEAAWVKFEQSEFAPFVGNVGTEWPEPQWTLELVKNVLQSMKKKAAPGLTGVPIGVWLALPQEWHSAVARLLDFVMEGGEWTQQAMEAYVSLIPRRGWGRMWECSVPSRCSNCCIGFSQLAWFGLGDQFCTTSTWETKPWGSEPIVERDTSRSC